MICEMSMADHENQPNSDEISDTLCSSKDLPRDVNSLTNQLNQ